MKEIVKANDPRLIKFMRLLKCRDKDGLPISRNLVSAKRLLLKFLDVGIEEELLPDGFLIGLRDSERYLYTWFNFDEQANKAEWLLNDLDNWIRICQESKFDKDHPELAFARNEMLADAEYLTNLIKDEPSYAINELSKFFKLYQRSIIKESEKHATAVEASVESRKVKSDTWKKRFVEFHKEYTKKKFDKVSLSQVIRAFKSECKNKNLTPPSSPTTYSGYLK